MASIDAYFCYGTWIRMVFVTISLAEIGDKSQLATPLFASNRENGKLEVFMGAALALVLAPGIGILAGDWPGGHVSPEMIKTIAGTGFMIVGVWAIIV